VETILAQYASPTVIILNDLELWWQSSENGFQALDFIFELLENYNRKHLFIVNCNFPSFRKIQSIKSVNEHFSGIIHCKPLDAFNLKELIFKRHYSGGMRIESEYLTESGGNRRQEALFFDAVFEFSGGMPAAAINAWLKHINRMPDNRLELIKPEKPDITVLEKLNAERLLFLAQLVLHKQLTDAKIKAIYHDRFELVMEQIVLLVQTGIVKRGVGGIYELNSYLSHYVIEILNDKEIF